MAAPTLWQYLSERLLAPITRTTWLSGECVRVSEYLRAAQPTFETGAMLGHRFRDRLPVFVRVLCAPGQEAETLKYLAELGPAEAARVLAEPRDFFDLFFGPEVIRLEQQVLGIYAEPRVPRAKLGKISRKKLALADALTGLKVAGERGLALGAHNPELVARLCGHRVDPGNWRVFRGRSTSLPFLPPAPRPLDDRQNEAMALLRDYVEQVQPDLLARLDLWPEEDNDFLQRLRAISSRWG